jgi:hypothetical protein
MLRCARGLVGGIAGNAKRVLKALRAIATGISRAAIALSLPPALVLSVIPARPKGCRCATPYGHEVSSARLWSRAVKATGRAAVRWASSGGRPVAGLHISGLNQPRTCPWNSCSFVTSRPFRGHGETFRATGGPGQIPRATSNRTCPRFSISSSFQ